MEAAVNKTHYTYEDWLSWDEDVRAEIIDGDLYMMAPPTRQHQGILTELTRQLANFLKGKSCKVYPAPFGVKLFENEDTALEPDIVVICDKSKLNEKGCNGAPDLVVEILSPSTGSRDKVLKFNNYLRAGVREYWIVDPDTKTVSVNVLDNSKYTHYAYANADTIPVSVLEGCQITLPDVFSEE